MAVSAPVAIGWHLSKNNQLKPQPSNVNMAVAKADWLAESSSIGYWHNHRINRKKYICGWLVMSSPH